MDPFFAVVCSRSRRRYCCQCGLFGNPDEPPEGAVIANAGSNIRDPRSQNPALVLQFPSAVSPPCN